MRDGGAVRQNGEKRDRDESLSILILRPRIVTTRRLVRFVTGLLSVGIFTLVRLVGIVGGRCLIGFIFFIGLVGLIRLSSLLVRLSVNDR